MSHRVAPGALPQTVRFDRKGYAPVEVELTRTSSPIVVEVLEEAKPARKASAGEDRRSASRAAHRARQDAARSGTPASNSASRDRGDKLSNERIESVMDEFLSD